MAAPRDAKPTSFLRAARRQQLVECAVDVIAEVGIAGASTVRIADHAGVSRGVLTYHFTGRDALLDQVVESVYDLGASYLGPKLTDATSPADFLAAFIRGSVELYAAHPKHMAALSEIFADRSGQDRPRTNHGRHADELRELADVLRSGQEQGQFREFDVGIMAHTIRRALDGALAHVAAGGSARRYASELQDLFEAATTSGRSG